MLDTDTKRRIDMARDILVGKVPDPKSQVEQITIALIYKFMDDMDAESEELGGKRSFFAGEYARYGWAKLMRSGLGGFETLNLYAEGITKMTENPAIPPLFRNIFKNAYLPYRDPGTLRAFLKVIDEFTYGYGDNLGDAFEYLLSCLGSQGNAGQFLTPRHIINFIVEIVDPKKNESVLDPACGTAGFLISAYRHILRQNTDEGGNITLTPEEKGQMAKNFMGYDISPDMVRLSLVNMYLHGFADPHIHEYDTLTSQDRWNEYADVILANPPFMSPKGGIRPHNRFSVRSTRSEVLFVDYMAEHLTPNGRAGIIVPEGVIFQGGSAYRQLRKMLVEDYLVAVVSLPAGVFNPYSIVKTSILILDKSLAKRSRTVAFFKVENDGFDLGAQRREIDKNDLPQVLAEVHEYVDRLRSADSVEDFQPTLGLIVGREVIAANGEYNLSGERYREGQTRIHAFPLARFADICTINPPKTQRNGLLQDTRVSFVPMADLDEHRMAFRPNQEKRLLDVSTSYTYFEDNDVLLAKVTPCFENGKAGIARGLVNGVGFGSSEFYVMRPGDDVMSEWLYFCVMHPLFRNAAIAQMTGTGGLQRIPKRFVEDFPVPLPPLEVQKEIVAEIAGYQKVIDGARAVVENYKPHIAIDPEWPAVELGDISEWITKGTTPTTNGHKFQGSGVNFIKIESIDADGEIDLGKVAFIDAACHEALKRSQLRENDILFSIAGSLGIAGLVRAEVLPANTNQALAIVRPKSIVDPRYIFHYLRSQSVAMVIGRLKAGVAQYNLSLKQVSEMPIPLPPLAAQQSIVAEIEAERALVDANRELITRFEKKIHATLARVWGEDAAETGDGES